MKGEWIVYVVLGAAALSLAVALASHVALVVLSFGAGVRRGVLAVVFPPVAWAAPLLAPSGAPLRRKARGWLRAFVVAAVVFAGAAFVVAGWVHALGVVEGVAGGNHH